MGEVDAALKPFEDRRGAPLSRRRSIIRKTDYKSYISRSSDLIPRRALSGKVVLQMCGLDRVPFRPSGLPMAIFLFETWFIYRSRFCQMLNFR